MKPDNEVDNLAQIRAAKQRSRGYAAFFEWTIDRDVEEAGVVSALVESMTLTGADFYANVKSRRRPNDPPDCEAVDAKGNRVAIEVTELVDGEAIRAFKAGRTYGWAEWSRDKFLSSLAKRIDAKDQRYPYLKEPPYDGGYIVVIHTDEPALSRTTVKDYLTGHRFPAPTHLSRAIIILSYDPVVQRCPYFELAFTA